MQPNPALVDVLAPAYQPCIEFQAACSREMRWQPVAGHVPRGFLGAWGSLEEVELVLVFAEPGDPHPHENHEGPDHLQSAHAYATYGFRSKKDQFHRNVRTILDACWPNVPFEQQLRKVWLTESVLCSARKEGGNVSRAASRACGRRYLLAQLRLFPKALVVALGAKANERLLALGYTKFIAAGSVAPPGCNRRSARDSWERVSIELRARFPSKG